LGAHDADRQTMVSTLERFGALADP